MPFYIVAAIIITSLLLQHTPASAEIRLFSGELEIVTVSGKACVSKSGRHNVSIVTGDDSTQEEVYGYLGGESLLIGHLHGSGNGSFKVHYPYPDKERAEGHSLQIAVNGDMLTGELHDRHLDPTVDDCNIDTARLKLRRVDDQNAASAVYQRFAIMYDARLALATARAQGRAGLHGDATANYEKALLLADKCFSADTPKLMPYITALANSYIRTARYQDYSDFYSSRIGTVTDEAVRHILNHHEIRARIETGRNSLGREDFNTALSHFNKALTIDYKNRDAISATMSALVRSGREDEAITFLEDTERKLDNEPDRKDVREAIALVMYRKAKKERLAGRTAEAEQLLGKAIKLDPGTSQYLIDLARLMHRSGRYGEADALLKRNHDLLKDEGRRKEIAEARTKLKMTESILAKIRKAGS